MDKHYDLPGPTPYNIGVNASLSLKNNFEAEGNTIDQVMQT